MSQVELLCLCRIGFEKEVAAELSDLAATCGVMGYVKAIPSSGSASFVCSSFDEARQLMESKRHDQLIFIRHWLITLGLQKELGTEDRVTPLSESFSSFPNVKNVIALNFDTNEGKSLAGLATSLARHVGRTLDKRGLLSGASPWLGQLLCVEGQSAYVGVAHIDHVSPWDTGILRLKVPRAAPSRATLKLEEAWHQFIPKKQWGQRLAPGMSAVDLGAAPGGWTWQLVNKSMIVDAIDNGPMAESLMDTGQVRHHVMDGFVYKPVKPVNWLVCDIADKPSRVASMIEKWAKNRWFSEAVFNLKLPMKQRYKAVIEAQDQIQDTLKSQGIRHSLRFKQLYHDREEVTGHLVLYPK